MGKYYILLGKDLRDDKMKVTLYAMKKDPPHFVKDQVGGGRWKWFVSLDMKVDRTFWVQEEARGYTLLLLHPMLSLGRAVDWRDMLSESGFDCSPDMPSGQLRMLILKYLGRSGAEISQKDPLIQTLECTLHPEHGWEEFGAAEKGFHVIGRKVCGIEEFKAKGDGYKEFCRSMLGRSLLPDEMVSLLEHLNEPDAKGRWRGFVQLAYLQGRVELQNGLAVTRKRRFPYLRRKAAYACRRCGSGGEALHWTACAACGEVCAYCEACLTMGRLRYCSLLVNGLTVELEPYDADETVPLEKIMRQGMNDTSRWVHGIDEQVHGVDKWNAGKWELSPSQQEAAEAGVAFVLETSTAASDASSGTFVGARTKADLSSFLIWAVTGAGKTEMIFPLIEAELARQGTVLIATPRKDVVLELEPRLKRAFPQNRLITLYGGSVERWDSGEITLATTHQLLRFRQKFDLIIIDEMDAFPFHNNPMLEFAARKVGKPSAKYIWLSATPPAAVQKAAQQQKLRHARVPVRFHRQPLPVPQLMKVKPLHKLVEGPFSKPFLRALAFSLSRGAQVFIFVPKIRYIDVLVDRLKQTLGDVYRIEGTSSKDAERREKVVDFRQGAIRILVTTTILERGVTVPKADVFVMEADSPMFDEAALVQMAGRAGRSSEDPLGWVYYAAYERTKSQTRAVRHIKQMNRLARRKGYLLP